MFKKFTWGHGMVVALLCFITFICSLIYYYQSQNNTFDLVTDRYYEEEIVFQQEIDAQNRANNLETKPQIQNTPEGILISIPNEFKNVKGNIILRHSSKKEYDIKSPLLLDENNQMMIPKKVLHSSIYELQVKWTKNKLNYRKDFKVVWK